MTHSEKSIACGNIFTILVVCLMLWPSSISAGIYQWTDANGNSVFTDSPQKGAAAKELKIKQTNQFGVPPQEENRSPVNNGNSEPKLRDLRDIRVVLYMTDWCPYCKKAREHLISQGVSLTEYDIDEDQGKREEMRRKSGSTSIPVIDVEGTVIRGFAPGAIDSAINSKRRSRN